MRVPLNSLPAGTILLAGSYRPAASASAHVYAHGTTTPVTVWLAETGSGTLAQPLTADANGQLPGWVDAGQELDVSVVMAGTSGGSAVAEPVAAQDVLEASRNLSDLANAATSRTNLGLGSAATQPSSAFDAAGAAGAAAVQGAAIAWILGG